MTPDDVVARAKELAGKRARVTVEGRVQVDSDGGDWVHLRFDDGLGLTLHHARCGATQALVSIEPAPLRIEPNTFYVDPAGTLYRGLVGSPYAGCVVSIDNWDRKYGPGTIRPLPDGLVPAKVVPA